MKDDEGRVVVQKKRTFIFFLEQQEQPCLQ